MSYPARRTDPVTSHLAARNITGRVSQCDRLLVAYALMGGGLSDEQAARIAKAPDRSCWWHRCSDLRQRGFIDYTIDEATQQPLLITGSLGRQVHVCEITGAGLAYLRTKELA